MGKPTEVSDWSQKYKLALMMAFCVFAFVFGLKVLHLLEQIVVILKGPA